MPSLLPAPEWAKTSSQRLNGGGGSSNGGSSQVGRHDTSIDVAAGDGAAAAGGADGEPGASRLPVPLDALSTSVVEAAVAAAGSSGGGGTMVFGDGGDADEFDTDVMEVTPNNYELPSMMDVLIQEVRTSVSVDMQSGSELDESLRVVLKEAGGTGASVNSLFTHLETAVRKVKSLAEKCGDRGTLGQYRDGAPDEVMPPGPVPDLLSHLFSSFAKRLRANLALALAYPSPYCFLPLSVARSPTPPHPTPSLSLPFLLARAWICSRRSCRSS